MNIDTSIDFENKGNNKIPLLWYVILYEYYVLYGVTLYKYHIFLRGDIVDCHPEETLSTEAEPGLTMLLEEWESTMSPRKECYIYFIIPNVPFLQQISPPWGINLLCHPVKMWYLYIVSPRKKLSTEAEPMLTMLFEGWQSTMSPRKECYIYFIIPNVPFLQQISPRETLPCDIQNCHPANWPIRLLEINMRYNKHKTWPEVDRIYSTSKLAKLR